MTPLVLNCHTVLNCHLDVCLPYSRLLNDNSKLKSDDLLCDNYKKYSTLYALALFPLLAFLASGLDSQSLSMLSVDYSTQHDKVHQIETIVY